jgi:hypothetical protein
LTWYSSSSLLTAIRAICSPPPPERAMCTWTTICSVRKKNKHKITQERF